MFGRGEQQIFRKRRAETLSRIAGERVFVEAMAERPRSAEDTIEAALLETVLARLTEIEGRAQNATNVDQLDDLEADAETQGNFAAYFCPVLDVKIEGERLLDQIEGWGIPKASVKRLRDLVDAELKNADSNPAAGRSALRALFEERDAWDEYVDDYEEKMSSLALKLFWSTVVLIPIATMSFHFAMFYSPLLTFGLLCSGGAGSCISVMRKMPALDVSLAGELDAYGRQVFSRTGVGIAASLIGSGLLTWLPVSVQNRSFTDALNSCAAGTATANTILILLALPMILGFSERTLTSFERRVFGEASSQ